MKCRAMTRIMLFCMLLVVLVSVFFYAPMEVRAEEIVSDDFLNSGSFNLGNFYKSSELVYSDSLDVFNGVDILPDKVYQVDLSFIGFIEFGESLHLRSTTFKLGDEVLYYSHNGFGVAEAFSYFSLNENRTFYLKGSSLLNNVLYFSCLTSSLSSSTYTSYNLDFDIVLNSLSVLSSDDSEDYQNGYNAGYSAGEQAGYGNGYSNGFSDGEASVDTDAIYDEAFQAGKDSVDTQSYYDAGYQAGYQVAFSEGYESGYDVGYQNAMDRIANWGADTSDYPLLKQSIDMGEFTFGFNVSGYVPHIVSETYPLPNLNFNINPNHTYKFHIICSAPYFDNWQADSSDFNCYLNVASSQILLSYDGFDFFLPGYLMSSDLIFEAVFYGSVMDENAGAGYVGGGCRNLDVDVYDLGPSGDTQNHIANQTDQLTNGYDSSQGAAVNDDFKASVNDYHTAEDSLFSTATTSLENFTFLDFTSITGMVTSLSFVTSIMTSIYMAMGGDTGSSGIILAVLFSVMLVSMAIGLYRYYVSNGRSDGSGKGGD